MPLYKNSKPLRHSQFVNSLMLDKNSNYEKSLTISQPVGVPANNNSFIPIHQEEKLTSNIFASPSPADNNNYKVAESPKESASFQIKDRTSSIKEATQVQKVFTKSFDNRLGENSSKKLNKEEQEKNGKNKTHQSKFKADSKKNTTTKLRELKKSNKKAAKKDERDNASSSDSQSSNLSISQQYLMMEKIIAPSPPENASKRERLEWLQNERYVGLYVQCDTCDKFRYLADVKDPTELPEKWYCFMNTDTAHNTCEAPEVKISARDEEDMIFNQYNAGSIVWAKFPQYPWWPAMVDDNPDTEQYYRLKTFSDFPTHYNVIFFEPEVVNIAWMVPKFLKPFRGNENMFSLKNTAFELQFLERFNFAKRQAIEALSYNLLDRLRKFSFIARWPHEFNAEDDRKDKKRHKKTNANKNCKININKIKNGKKTVEDNGENNRETIFYIEDQQMDEADWEKTMNKEITNYGMDNTIPISYSPDVSLDIDF